MKAILSLSILLFSFSSFGQFNDSKVETKLSDVQKDELKKSYLKDVKSDHELAVKLMRLDLAPYIMKLNRDIVTYNYRHQNFFSNKKLSELDKTSDSQDAIDYAKTWAVAAKQHIPDESGLYGWGLYSARDPYSSIGYSYGSDIRLTTVKYPKDGSMLDLRRFGSEIPISSETRKVFQKICPPFYGSKTSVDKSYLIRDKNCHKIYIEVMESFNIQGVIYGFSHVPTNLCDTKTTDSSAFVAFNLKIEKDSIDFLATLPEEIQKEAQNIQMISDSKEREEKIKKFSLGEKTFRDFERLSSYIQQGFPEISFENGQAFKPFYSNDPEVQKKHRETYQEETFACSKKYDEADKITYRPEQVWDVLLEDSKIIETLSTELKSLLEDCK